MISDDAAVVAVEACFDLIQILSKLPTEGLTAAWHLLDDRRPRPESRAFPSEKAGGPNCRIQLGHSLQLSTQL